MIYGYCRISTKKQSIERQIRNIKSSYPDAKIIEESFTGAKLDRPEWLKLNRRLKAGDVVIFDDVSRMSRNAKEGFKTYQRLMDKGVSLVFLKQPHINTASYQDALKGICNTSIQSGDDATNDLVAAIMAAVNQFMLNKVQSDILQAFEQAQKEVDDLHNRTKEGIETARLNGKQIGLQKGTKLTTKKSLAAKQVIMKHNKDFGGTLSNEETWKLAGISKMTFYKYKRELLSE